MDLCQLGILCCVKEGLLIGLVRRTRIRSTRVPGYIRAVQISGFDFEWRWTVKEPSTCKDFVDVYLSKLELNLHCLKKLLNY